MPPPPARWRLAVASPWRARCILRAAARRYSWGGGPQRYCRVYSRSVAFALQYAEGRCSWKVARTVYCLFRSTVTWVSLQNSNANIGADWIAPATEHGQQRLITALRCAAANRAWLRIRNLREIQLLQCICCKQEAAREGLCAWHFDVGLPHYRPILTDVCWQV